MLSLQPGAADDLELAGQTSTQKKNSFHIILSLHSTLWFRVAAPILNHDLIYFTRSPPKDQKKVDSNQVNSCCPWQTASGEVRDTCEYCPVHVQKKKRRAKQHPSSVAGDCTQHLTPGDRTRGGPRVLV